MIDEDKELKPCPLCGSVAELYFSNDYLSQNGEWYIKCSNDLCELTLDLPYLLNCYCKPKLEDSSAYVKREVIRRWNRRNGE